METKSGKKLQALFSRYKTVRYKRGQILLRPGDSVTKLHLLLKGMVKQYMVLPSGEEVTIHVYRPGAVLPMVLVLAEVANRFYFETISLVELKSVAVGPVLAFVKQNPDVLLNLAKRFSKAVDGLVTRLEHTLSQSARARVARLLVYWAEKFGGKRFTHRDIASWTGLTRETVSRELGLLKSRGFIANQTTIIDIAGLRKESLGH